MKTIRTQYRLATDFLLREISIYFFITVATFLLLTIFTTYLFGQNPDMVQNLLSQVVEKFQGIMVDGQISPTQLFLNNLQASVLGILIGLIPFLFLPLIGIFSNAAILGIVFSSYQAASVPLWKLIVVGILPHGIFELTAVFLCYAMGLCICWNLTKKIIGHRKRENLKDLLQNCLRATVLIVLPLLIAAALVETYVTVQLVSAFL
jgi:stage II sporulation protein M